MVFQRKYNTATAAASHVRVPMIKRGAVDFAFGADWTPAAGDVKAVKDGGAAANIGTLPSAVTVGNTAYWEFPLSAAELSCKQLVVTVADGSPKAVEDNMFVVETFGNASAMIPADLSDGARLGLSSLPNAAPAGAGGLPTVDAANRITGIAGTKNTLDALNDLSGAAIASLGLDAPVSSRLAAASYSAPDNSGIAAVKAKTDNLPANPAAIGSPMTLDLTQAVPTSNTPETVGDALNAARVAGFGAWVLDTVADPPTLTLLAEDGVTPVHVFTLDSATITTRRT